MADNWDTDTPAVAVGGLADQPEIKLFGRWSSSDVVVSDISLTVSLHSVHAVCHTFDITIVSVTRITLR